MKKYLIKTALFVSILLCSPMAKAQKIAHVNFQEIIVLMPEYEKASKEYEIYQASLEDDLKEIENRAGILNQKLDAEQKKPQPSSTKLKIYQQQMEELQQEYTERQQTIKDSMTSKLAQLIAPIRTKVEAIIAEIAKEMGYSHVIDKNSNVLIFADETYNLDKIVKDRLKIKEKPKSSVLPGSGSRTMQRR